ncbi:MAG: hypothetical protein ACR2JO_01325 [Mycobacteriales bacterium]
MTSRPLLALRVIDVPVAKEAEPLLPTATLRPAGLEVIWVTAAAGRGHRQRCRRRRRGDREGGAAGHAAIRAADGDRRGRGTPDVVIANVALLAPGRHRPVDHDRR